MSPAQVRCPICDKAVDPRHTPAMPFCSERCQQLDLGRWLNEDYGMAIEREDDMDESYEG